MITAYEIFFSGSFLSLLYSELSFGLPFVLSVALLSFHTNKRKNFILRVILCLLTFFIINICYGFIYFACPAQHYIYSQICKYILLYIIIVQCVWICYDCSFWGALFCGTAAYCIQHIASLIFSICEITIFSSFPSLVIKFLSFFFILLIYFIIYCLLKKGARYYESRKFPEKKMQIIVSIITITTIVIMDVSFGAIIYGNVAAQCYKSFFSILCAFFVFLFQLGISYSDKVEMENDIIKRMLHEERTQYIIEKNVTDTINIKCHDLKHQLTALKGKIDAKELEQISSVVVMYGQYLETGNKAIDIVLREHSQALRDNKIRLTCFIDGEALNFIAEPNIYSLFGNAVENAIFAVEKLEPEKRIISISDRKHGNLIDVRIENYYDGSLILHDGLPVTTKNDKDYHGFGVKSMRYIVEEYGGTLYVSADEDKFILEFIIPLPESKK